MLWRVLRAAFEGRSSASALIRRALDLRARGELAQAEQILRTAVIRHPRDAVAATNLATVLLEQDEAQEAAGLLQKAIEIDPRCAAAHFNYANMLRIAQRPAEAIVHYRAAAAAGLDFGAAPEELMNMLLETCAWNEAEAIADDLRAKVRDLPEAVWMRSVSPLTGIYLGLEREKSKRLAVHHASFNTVRPLTTSSYRRGARERIRIGYFSRDFRNHAVGHVLRGVFALHDRSRFETYAFSFGPNDGSVYRKAIEGSVEHFVDVARHSDDQAAHAIADARIDILIDLMGHTTGNRLPVLARRPAPVQAHYLGYPATTGAPYIDYFMSDDMATPQHLAGDFTEEIAYVAECFMATDRTEAAVVTGVTRADQKLPQDAFVFTNFGSPSRITRETFSLWMRILAGVPGSVLWLARANELVVANLAREARAAGVDSGRLIFAERAEPKSAHLARLTLADLMLDTLGWYNGHSSTADMLWAGVPVLTAPGNTFASRVAASLTRACRLNDLLARDSEDYVSKAIRLGMDRSQVDVLRHDLHAARASAPFFDTAQRVRALETAYEWMLAAKMH